MAWSVEYRRKWLLKNGDKRNKYQRLYYAKNKEKIKAYVLEWRRKNKDKVKIYSKKYRGGVRTREWYLSRGLGVPRSRSLLYSRIKSKLYWERHKSDPAYIKKHHAANARWCAENVEKKRKLRRETYYRHREEYRIRAREWKLRNIERVKAYGKLSYKISKIVQGA
jgi:hypothetical protein